MKVASIRVCENVAYAYNVETITSDMVGATVSYEFSNEWDGLNKTAVFKAGDVVKSRLFIKDNEPVEIPCEVLDNSGVQFYAGVYGANANGDEVIPTTWAYVNIISEGAVDPEKPDCEPSPGWADQIQDGVQSAIDVAQSVRDDADSGKFNGKDGDAGATFTPNTKRVDGGVELSFENDKELPNPDPVIVKDGTKGDVGVTFVPHVTDVDNGVELSFTNDGGMQNPETKVLTNGKDGDDRVYVGPDPAPPKTAVQIETDGESIVIPDVVQDTGISDDDVMSQHATTAELDKKLDKTVISQKSDDMVSEVGVDQDGKLWSEADWVEKSLYTPSSPDEVEKVVYLPGGELAEDPKEGQFIAVEFTLGSTSNKATLKIGSKSYPMVRNPWRYSDLEDKSPIGDIPKKHTVICHLYNGYAFWQDCGYRPLIMYWNFFGMDLLALMRGEKVSTPLLDEWVNLAREVQSYHAQMGGIYMVVEDAGKVIQLCDLQSHIVPDGNIDDYSMHSSNGKQCVIFTVDFVGKTLNAELINLATKNDIQDLEDSKANYTYKVIASDNVSQIDAREVLTYPEQYEGKLIEFLTNGDNPSKCVATGRVMTDASGNSYLITYNRDGSSTQWNKDSFEKRMMESISLINEPIVDIDNLTVDVAGNPPVLYLVRNAKNKPENTSVDGTVFVMPHAIDKQIQFYTDMESGKQWYRLVTGLANAHSFGIWRKMGSSGGEEQVQSNWAENDPQSPAYVKNRPFYSNVTSNNVYPTQLTVFENMGGQYGAFLQSITTPLEDGDIVSVSFDQQEYRCKAIFLKELDLVFAGRDPMNPDSSSEFPFTVGYSIEQNATMIVTYDSKTEHELGITYESETIVRIPNEFIDFSDVIYTLPIAKHDSLGGVKASPVSRPSSDKDISIEIKDDGSLFVNIDDIKSYLYKEGFTPEILVYAQAGSHVVCKKADKEMSADVSDGPVLFRLDSPGQWNVTVSLNGKTTGEESVDVTMIKRYIIHPSIRVYGARWAGMPGTKWERTDSASGFSDPVPSVGGSIGSSPFDDIAPWSGMRRETRAAGEMVAIPKYWIKVQNYGDGGIWVQIADSPLDGFVCSPGHSDRGDGRGERDVIYVGRYHCGEDWKSTTGVLPKVYVTRPGSNNEIHSVDPNTWLWDWATMWTVKYLYLVEFADWNSQSTIGFGCGDSSGVSNMGYTDSMPYHTGTTMSSRSEYGFSTQYRYIEGLWDNAFDWVGGCYYNKEGLNVIMNPSNYSEDTGGKLVGSLADGYSSKFKVGNMPWAIVPTESNGDSVNGLSDGWYYVSVGPCLYVGGNYSQGDNRGMFCVFCHDPGNAGDHISARSMELP